MTALETIDDQIVWVKGHLDNCEKIYNDAPEGSEGRIKAKTGVWVYSKILARLEADREKIAEQLEAVDLIVISHDGAEDQEKKAHEKWAMLNGMMLDALLTSVQTYAKSSVPTRAAMTSLENIIVLWQKEIESKKETLE